MSVTTTGITIVDNVPYGRGRRVRVSTINVDQWMQCYVAGDLLDAKDASSGLVEFDVNASSTDPIMFVSVTTDDSGTNFWDDAFPLTDTNGDKILVRLVQDGVTYETGDVWRVFLGAAGAGSATIERYKAPMFPGGRFALGFGLGTFGTDSFGFDGANAAGFGAVFGLAPFGLDANYLEWESETMPPGTYPVKVTVEDSLGNTSTPFTDTISLATYARAATNLVVTSYDSGTDTLVLGFTATPDHP